MTGLPPASPGFKPPPQGRQPMTDDEVRAILHELVALLDRELSDGLGHA